MSVPESDQAQDEEEGQELHEDARVEEARHEEHGAAVALHFGVRTLGLGAQGNNGFFRSGIIAAWRFDIYTVESLKS